LLTRLPPIAGEKLFESEKSGIEILAGNALWSPVRFYELTEIMRQREDGEFAAALNNIPYGSMTEKEINLIRSRVGIPFSSSATHLMRTNSEINSFNSNFLDGLSTAGVRCTARDVVNGKKSAEEKEKHLEKVKHWSLRRTANLPLNLDLKLTAPYMITINLDVQVRF
jgi:hypothetical protein